MTGRLSILKEYRMVSLGSWDVSFISHRGLRRFHIHTGETAKTPLRNILVLMGLQQHLFAPHALVRDAVCRICVWPSRCALTSAVLAMILGFNFHIHS